MTTSELALAANWLSFSQTLHAALLAAQRTGSAEALAAKAVVLIHPENHADEIVWPQ